MGLSLEGYSITWDELYERLHSRNVEPVFRFTFSNLWDFDSDAQAAWRRALPELQTKIDDPADEYYPELTETAQVAFLAIVRHFGEICGTLTHNSRAGEVFREEFLEKVANSAFREPELSGWLTDRPFHGLAGSDFPAWGGLKRTEIDRLLSNYDAGIAPENLDLAGWLNDLREMLLDGKRFGRDLITLYY